MCITKNLINKQNVEFPFYKQIIFLDAVQDKSNNHKCYDH